MGSEIGLSINNEKIRQSFMKRFFYEKIIVELKESYRVANNMLVFRNISKCKIFSVPFDLGFVILYIINFEPFYLKYLQFAKILEL